MTPMTKMSTTTIEDKKILKLSAEHTNHRNVQKRHDASDQHERDRKLED